MVWLISLLQKSRRSSTAWIGLCDDSETIPVEMSNAGMETSKVK